MSAYPNGYAERPSDYERRAHFQERLAREALRPERHQLLRVLPTTKSGARVQPDAAKNTTNQEQTLMAAETTMTARPVKRDWYENHEELVGAMDWALGEDRLDRDDLYEYVSEPWHYDHLYDAWRVSLHAEAADDNRVDGYMEADVA